MATKQSSPKKKPTKGIDPLVEASVHFTSEKPLSPEAFLALNSKTSGMSPEDLVRSELQAARLLNVDMPDEPKQFIRLLETRIREITNCAKNVILILDEDSGTYRCLNDELKNEQSPRELTWISDRYLQDLLGTDQVIHSFLHYQGNVFGIIAIADRLDGKAFSSRDEVVLEQLTQYLSVQVNHFLMLKRSMMLPTIQRILLQLSNRLLCAVDSKDIFRGALSCLTSELPFTAGQYIKLNAKNGKGKIIEQQVNGKFSPAVKHRDVSHFVSILSLFQSSVWSRSYLYLKGDTLGDKKFSELFGLDDVSAVIVLPIVTADNQIDGALVLFQQGTPVALSKEALEALEKVPGLVTSAISRASVLENALAIATTDELTGALNRRGFYERFDGEMDRARRNQTPMCLALIDIDHFKMVNDTYGHVTGDQLLKLFTEALHKNIRKSDILCRYGGEEFALLLPETSIQAAHELVERLRKKIARTGFETNNGALKVTFSAGLKRVETMQSLAKTPLVMIEEAISNVDKGLYQAKQNGRNCVIVIE